MKRLSILLALAALLAGCSWDEVLGTAGRTAKNVCTNAPNCTVYGEDGQARKEWDPWYGR